MAISDRLYFTTESLMNSPTTDGSNQKKKPTYGDQRPPLFYNGIIAEITDPNDRHQLHNRIIDETTDPNDRHHLGITSHQRQLLPKAASVEGTRAIAFEGSAVLESAG